MSIDHDLFDEMLPWQAPAPVRRSRFQPAAPQYAALNVEVNLGRIGAFHFTRRGERNVLLLDFQTQLDQNYPRRLGSGRGGVYRGYYLKGVGRTLAAANWNDTGERYHGSGHMPPTSAAREWLITQYLRSSGLAHTIVPCETVLAAPLTATQRHEISAGYTSVNLQRAPADGLLQVLSAKQANFARMSNIVWALDHFCFEPGFIGRLFLALDRLLRPPDARNSAQGDPAEIAEAMEAAYLRTLSAFRSWSAHGLFWLYLQNNFTLDGRYVDLETPLLFGSPFVGIRHRARNGEIERTVIGFEELWLAWYWRLFLARLRHQLQYLCFPGVLPDRPAFLYVRQVLREINGRFPASHPIFDNKGLAQSASAHLARLLHLKSKAKHQLSELAIYQLANVTGAKPPSEPDLSWIEAPAASPFIPIGSDSRVFVPGWLATREWPTGLGFDAKLKRLEHCREPRQFLEALSN
ncbi:MAG: hypothetical protein HY821_08110 [Acidobacteria bacterium]|nr:hypothetical protein [Acidobacteriota bacterium]